jgi:hypothetical protein
MRVILKLVLIILLAGLLLGGFFWWLSGGTLSGTGQPEDLGVEYSEIDAGSAREKAGVEIMAVSPMESYFQTISYKGSHPVETVFTQEELSALVSGGTWEYYPLRRVQIKINYDASFEASGLVLADRLGDYIETTGEKDNLATRMIRLLGYHKGNIPFYAKGFVAIKDNEPDLNFEKIKVGPLSLPLTWIKRNSVEINDFVRRQLSFVEGLYIESLEIKDGQLRLVGTLPNIERVVIE